MLPWPWPPPRPDSEWWCGVAGFEVSTRGCCGTGDLEVSLLCNQLTAPTCPDDRKYVFWDSFHPTEKAYEIIVDYLFPRYIENLL